MDVNRRTKAEQGEATRDALVAAARELFAERGYAAVGTEEIVQRAGVTRGALYHHFRDKEALFLAVFEQVEVELVADLGRLAAGASDPLDALRRGAEGLLDLARDPAVQRITLIDAPAVLGYDVWREVGARHALGLVEGVLEAAVDAGQIRRQPVKPLAHVLMGALDEAAMMVARAEDPDAARREMGATLATLIGGLAPR